MWTDERIRDVIVCLVVLVAVGLGLSGCGFMFTGGCPEPEDHHLENTVYTPSDTMSDSWSYPHAGEGLEAENVEELEVRVDKENEIVEISYRQEGERVVETWGITEVRPN